jgi:hypothetical protein
MDDDFPLSVSLLQIPDGLWDLGERVRPVDDRRDLPGLDEVLEDEHVLVVLLIDECAQLLAHERGQRERPELAIGASEPPSSPFAADDDEGPPEARARRRRLNDEFPPTMSRIRS